MPRPPAISPLSRLPPESDATKASPSSASMKNSGEPKESTSGRTTGIASASANAPNRAPMSELASTAPSARPASPFFAIGCPSTIVEAVVGSPGTPNRMDVMSPVVAVTAAMPSRNANASAALMVKMNGNISASVVGPPSPGRMPTTKPSAMPASISASALGANTRYRPATNAWARSSTLGAVLLGQDGRLELVARRRVDGEHVGHQARELVGVHRIDGQLRLLGLGEEILVLERRLEGAAQRLHVLLGRARREREWPRDGAGILHADLDQPARLGSLGEAHRQRHIGNVGERLGDDLHHRNDVARLDRLAPGDAHRFP